HDHAVADDAELFSAKNSGGHEVQDVLLFANKDRVAGIVAAGVSDNDVRFFREDVDDFAFAFVAPLGAYQNCVHILAAAAVTIKIPEPGFGVKHVVFTGRK